MAVLRYYDGYTGTTGTRRERKHFDEWAPSPVTPPECATDIAHATKLSGTGQSEP